MLALWRRRSRDCPRSWNAERPRRPVVPAGRAGQRRYRQRRTTDGRARRRMVTRRVRGRRRADAAERPTTRRDPQAAQLAVERPNRPRHQPGAHRARHRRPFAPPSIPGRRSCSPPAPRPGSTALLSRADGWLPANLPFDAIAAGWTTIRDGAAAAGRDPHTLELIVRAAPTFTTPRSDRRERPSPGRGDRSPTTSRTPETSVPTN